MIRIQLLGVPQIHKDNNLITFPYKKAETIFYYIATHRSVSRAALTDLFWPDLPSDNAKKNLRDALYKIRKSFNMDIVTSTKKTTVEFNCQEDFTLDVDELLEGKLDVYRGQYLSNVMIKNNDIYDEYLEEQRRFYAHQFRTMVLESDKVEDSIVLSAMKSDPFDELLVRKYMSLMIEQKDYPKAIESYQRLEKVLDDELFIEPESATTRLYEELLSLRAVNDAPKQSINIFGRKAELENIVHLLKMAKDNRYHQHHLYIGEAGIGKSTFLKAINVLGDNEQFKVIKTDCYQAEKQFTLKPWHQILDQLQAIIVQENIELPARWISILHHLFPRFMHDLEHDHLENIERIDSLKSQLVLEAIVGIFNSITDHQAVMLMVEDIQWMDSFSLELLSNVILHHGSQRLVVIMSMRSDYNGDIDHPLRALLALRRIHQLKLSGFTLDEAHEFLKLQEPNSHFTDDQLSKAMKITNGNPLFLREWGRLNSAGDHTILTSNDILGIIDSRLLDLQADEILVLEAISIFFKKATIEELEHILAMDAMKLLMHLETLKHRLFIEEVEQDTDVFFKISHQYIHDYLYQQLSKTRKMLWHREYVKYLEKHKQSNHNDLHLTSLMVHADAGHEPLKAMQYALEYYHYYSELNYELFPSISSHTAQGLQKFSSLHAFEYIDYYAKKVPNLREYPKLWMEYQYLKGRYDIKEGNYDQGRIHVESLIECALENENHEYLFKGYVQMIYFGIQMHDMNTLKEYISLGFTVVSCKGDRATLYRLKGLYEILTGQYEMAEKSLNESLLLQHESKLATIMNEAAIYNYKGDLALAQGAFELGITHYQQAINCLKDRDILRGLTLFYGNLGKAYYLNGDYVKAKKSLLKALSQYDQFNIHWKKSMVSGYMALIAFEEKHYDEANFHFSEAKKAFEKIKNPVEGEFLQHVRDIITTKGV